MAATSPARRSGLIVEVPEAEPTVARLRERFDASPALGFPAQITVDQSRRLRPGVTQ